jgi:hypothetical protein
MSNDSSERVALTRAEADARLKPGKAVHTFMQARAPGMVLIGADWDREEILALADLGKVELAGETATNMQHGVVAHTDRGPVFCETISAPSPAPGAGLTAAAGAE